ncbi:chymotrypsinogen B2-like protein, partial [Dinothrombium tinctorium]
SNSEACGTSNAKVDVNLAEPRIIKGVDARPGEVPGYAMLTMTYCVRWLPFLCSTSLCGGSIWDKNTIITAAHCVVDSYKTSLKSKITVCIGAYERTNPNDKKKCYIASNSYVYPMYFFNQSYDFAVVKVDQGMDVPDLTSDGYGSTDTFCPPEENVNYRDYICRIAGFGIWKRETQMTAPILQVAPMTILPNEECRKVFPTVTECQICVQGEAGETACNGDSGGPLYCFKSKGAPYHVIGATSFGIKTCPENGVVVYTKVACYLDFIRDVSFQQPIL